jgi:antitoxin PrlF
MQQTTEGLPVMGDATMTAKGQTTIPREVRAAMGLEPGDTIRFLVVDGRARMLKMRSVMDLQGMLERPGQRSYTIEEMNDAIAEAAAESVRNSM